LSLTPTLEHAPSPETSAFYFTGESYIHGWASMSYLVANERDGAPMVTTVPQGDPIECQLLVCIFRDTPTADWRSVLRFRYVGDDHPSGRNDVLSTLVARSPFPADKTQDDVMQIMVNQWQLVPEADCLQPPVWIPVGGDVMVGLKMLQAFFHCTGGGMWSDQTQALVPAL
jgi:hypothetical protein